MRWTWCFSDKEAFWSTWLDPCCRNVTNKETQGGPLISTAPPRGLPEEYDSESCASGSPNPPFQEDRLLLHLKTNVSVFLQITLFTPRRSPASLQGFYLQSGCGVRCGHFILQCLQRVKKWVFLEYEYQVPDAWPHSQRSQKRLCSSLTVLISTRAHWYGIEVLMHTAMSSLLLFLSFLTPFSEVTTEKHSFDPIQWNVSLFILIVPWQKEGISVFFLLARAHNIGCG